MIRIAVDGPASAGKGTTAKLIAEKLGIAYIDTGAMYRMAGLAARRAGIPLDGSEAAELFKAQKMEIVPCEGGQQYLLNGEDVTTAIRTAEAGRDASVISAQPAVRAEMSAAQRRMAENSSMVMDGRDIGTVVLPNAEYKFFVTAKPEIRAKRRQLELEQRGEHISFEQILTEINERDERDRTRPIAPLIQAEDAILCDTSYVTPEEAAEFCLSFVKEYKK